MKTYEEMARDVLKRRDEELLRMKNTDNYTTDGTQPEVVYPASAKKRRLLPMIAVPCAAAVLVGAVGVTVWNRLPQRGEQYIQSGVETGDPENQHTEIVPEPPYSTLASNCHSGSPGSAKETKINIVKLDGNPLGKICEGTDQIHIDIDASLEYKFELLTIEELNELYQIEFNKLSRLHTDWVEGSSSLGRVVRETPGVTTESYAASGSREIISTSNRLTYKTPDGAKIGVTADRDFKTDLSELGFSEEDFSVLGGYRAIVASASHDGEILYGAIIDMAGTNVQISAEGLSEEEFVQVLREYTADENAEDIIIIHDTMPEFFMAIYPFGPVCGNIFDDLDFEPISDINRYYELEFDRLTKLHSDWKELHGDFGIYTRTTDDEVSVKHEIIWTRNHINYTLPNGAVLRVSAQIDSLNLVTPGMPLVGERVYSRVNGCDAMIYRSEPIDTVEYPNNNAGFDAVVEMGRTVIHFSAAGLTEEEFLNVLREYTAPNPDFDASQVVDVPPVVADPTDLVPETWDHAFTAVDAFYEKTSYTVNLSDSEISLELNREYQFGVSPAQDGEIASKYISEFFGTDIFPIDEQYKNSFRRYVDYGYFVCGVAPQTKLVSPVDGKVIGVNKFFKTYNDLGNAIAVEFGNGNIFIATQLGEMDVSVGDTVTAGQTLGICGYTGKTNSNCGLGLYLLKYYGRPE